MLNESKGNMYPFVTHTWNAIKGKCPHDCSYCYMKIWKQNDIRLVEAELKTDLGKHNYIFVGSSTDMWADDVPTDWIHRVLKYCRDNDVYNKYLFQTKNPERMLKLSGFFPDNTVLACTIETNRIYPDVMGNAPNTFQRKTIMMSCPYPKMISIEPVLDFDLDRMIEWIRHINPEFVSIGADSKGHNLPEPSSTKLSSLINELNQFTKIVQKKNLARIL